MEKGNALVVLCASNLRCRCTQLLFFLSLFLIFISGIQQKKKENLEEKKKRSTRNRGVESGGLFWRGGLEQREKRRI